MRQNLARTIASAFVVLAMLGVSAPPAGAVQLTGWVSLGGVVLRSPAVASTSPNTARVFVWSSDDAIWTRSFLNGGWTGWSSIGGRALDGPSASARGSAIDVFVHGGDDAVWQNTCQASCTGWTSIGGLTESSPASVSWAADRIDVFIRGGDNQLWHRAANGGVWGAWEPLGGTLSSAPSVTSRGVNSLDVAVRGADAAVWTRSWNGSSWTPWVTAGGRIIGQPALVARPGGPSPSPNGSSAGVVDLYVRGPDSSMWYSQRTSGTWQGFQPVGGGLTAGPAATALRTSPSPQELVAVRGGDGGLWVNVANLPP